MLTHAHLLLPSTCAFLSRCLCPGGATVHVTWCSSLPPVTHMLLHCMCSHLWTLVVCLHEELQSVMSMHQTCGCCPLKRGTDQPKYDQHTLLTLHWLGRQISPSKPVHRLTTHLLVPQLGPQPTKYLQGYGLTETCAASFLAGPFPGHSGTVGPPVPGTEYRLEGSSELG